MSLALSITLIVLAVIILVIGGLAGWYEFYRLRKPQMFLVSMSYEDVQKMGGLNYVKESGDKLAELYKGTVATKQDLYEAFKDGLYVLVAGYVSDETGKSTNCVKNQDNPYAYYPLIESDGTLILATACSRGYWIKGIKPSKSNAIVPGTKFSVMEYDSSRWNKYEIHSFKEFWDAITGKA